jgi:threonine/homoserine/homoserine lactone efflux protein
VSFSILASGFGAGFLIAAQVGPIWLLCFRNGIRFGFPAAFGIGLGAALIDTLYCVLGALGAAVLLSAHSTQRVISIVGALVISWIGIRTILTHRKTTGTGIDEVVALKAPSFGSALRLSLLATASNPLTIISWVALLSAAGTFINATSGKIVFALGVGGGSFLFFLTLSLTASYMGRRLSDHWVRRIDQISAYLFLVFALLLAYRAFTI